MELLLSNGADINAINEMGDTCLHKAAFIGRQVDFLLISNSFSISLTNHHIVRIS